MPPPSNNKLILKIAFVVLFLVLLGELGYIFMTVNKKIPLNSLSTVIPTIPTPTPTFIPFFLTSQYRGTIIKFNEIKDDQTTPTTKKIELSFTLEIESGEEKDPGIFFFYKKEVDLLKVIDSTGKIISYKDLRVGQKIILNQKYNQNDQTYTDLEIKILN